MIYYIETEMALLYFLFCYVTSLTDQVDGYVLLAANLEDFRSIAKKFVPEKLADQIVDMAANHRVTKEPEYSQESDISLTDPTYEGKTDNHKKSLSRQNLNQNAAGYSIDEIVEKVKQKLLSEFKNQSPKEMVQLTSGNGGNPILNQYDYRGPDNRGKEQPLYEEAMYDVVPETPSPHRIQQGRLPPKRIVDRNIHTIKNNRYVGNVRMVEQERQSSPQQVKVNKVRFVEQPMLPVKTIPTLKPNYLKLKPKVHRLLKSDSKIVGNKKKFIRRPQPTTARQEIITEMDLPEDNEQMVFEAVDMLKSNDSYEEYVIPPKEKPYATYEEERKTPAKLVITFKPIQANRAPTLPGPLMEQPLAEDIMDADVYDDEPTEATTPAELKARTESLSYEEKETKGDPNVTTTTEVTVKGKGKPKIKIGTMIPTREYFKLSSPNYYGNLPTIAEKYNFNEPIPEQDREPENLNPIGAPPSNINGKTILI